METALKGLLPESDESALALQAKGGDRRAFGELVERHMRRAYRNALALTGSHDDALDLSQEAFARAFRARRRLDPSLPFYPWYYQILRRLCFNFLRDSSRRAGRLSEASGWLIESARRSQSAQRPDLSIERSELRKKLQAAIDSLPDREREAFALKEFEGLRYREIAELAGIPIGTVMSRLYAARRRLALILEDER